MMDKKNNTAILLLSCEDQKGLVSGISEFIFKHGGNITDLEEYVDQEENIFSIRIQWDLSNFAIEREKIKSEFESAFAHINADYEIYFADIKSRVAVFVSKFDHCLREILWRNSINEFPIEIPMIISNHEDCRLLAEHYGVPYYIFSVTKENKALQEAKELELLKKSGIDAIVLARYMQILSPDILRHFPNKIINIHHSFLPAFAGGSPYKQAYQRGVKIIGATSHYVTEELDEGPIIEQGIVRVSHKDTLDDLVRKGRDVERMVLAQALSLHSDHRVLARGNKTIVFT
jgi:formyltetrahydrofolate deformylase